MIYFSDKIRHIPRESKAKSRESRVKSRESGRETRHEIRAAASWPKNVVRGVVNSFVDKTGPIFDL